MTTLALITNPEVLAVNQASANNRQLFRQEDSVAWIADGPISPSKYLAVFNLGSAKENALATALAGMTISVDLKSSGFPNGVRVRDLWAKRNLGNADGIFSALVPAHSAELFGLSPPGARE